MAILYQGTTPKYQSLAKEIATDRDEPLVETVADAPDEVVVYVSEPTEIDEETVLRLQQRMARNGPEKGGFSIITGPSPEDARNLYYAAPTSRDEHMIALREETTDWFSYDDETSVHTSDDVTVERLADAADDLASLSMLVHGRSMHFFFDDGYLCGFPGERDDASFDGTQPYCVQDGERACPLEGDLLHADALSVPHLFIDSCASMLPGNDYEGLPVHVGINLLRGATSAIGVYRQIDSLPQMSLLHYCLLRSGYSVVERCYVLNRTAHAYRTTAHPYVPFGRPEASLESATSGEASTGPSAPDEVDLQASSSDRAGRPSFSPEREFDYSPDDGTIRVEDVDTHLLRFTLPGAAAGSDDRYYVRNTIEEFADAPLYYSAFPEGEDLVVLVFTWGRLEAEQLEFAVSDEMVGDYAREVVSDAITNAERVEQLGLMDNKANGQVKDLKNRIGGFAEKAKPQLYSVNAHWDFEERVERALDSIDRIASRICTQLDDRYSTFLSDEYREEMLGERVEADDEHCSTCGRQLYRKRMGDWLGQARRVRGICPLCGVVYDAPHLRDHSLSYPEITGDLVHADGTAEVTMTFENPLDVRMRSVWYPWLGTSNDEFRAREVFEPAELDVELDPGEQLSRTFTVDTTGLEPNEYWVCGYVVGNLNVYQGLTKMVVGDQFGHLRDDLREDD